MIDKQCRTCKGTGKLECAGCKGAESYVLRSWSQCAGCGGKRIINCPRCEDLMIYNNSNINTAAGAVIATGTRKSAPKNPNQHPASGPITKRSNWDLWVITLGPVVSFIILGILIYFTAN